MEEQELIKRLSSSDPAFASDAMAQLIAQWMRPDGLSNWLYRWFYSKTGNHQDTEDLGELLYLRLNKRLHEERPWWMSKSFILQAAEWAFLEWVKKQKHQTGQDPKLSKNPQPKSLNEEFQAWTDDVRNEENLRIAIGRIHQLLTPLDYVWYSLGMADYSPEQTACLIAPSASTIRRRQRAFEQKTRDKATDDVLLNTVVPWEVGGWNSDNGFLGITTPKCVLGNLHPDDERALVELFSVKSYRQFLSLFRIFLVVFHAFTEYAVPHICVIERKYTGWALIEQGANIPYWSFKPQFDQRRENGQQRWDLHLLPDVQYHSTPTKRYFDDRLGENIVEFEFVFPNNLITVRKRISFAKLPLYDNPDSAKAAINAFEFHAYLGKVSELPNKTAG